MARSELPGVIFTHIWVFDVPEDRRYVEELRDIFEAHGERVVYPELWADLETRLERHESPSRVEAKPSKRDLAISREHLTDARYRLSSDGDSAFSSHLFLITASFRRRRRQSASPRISA